MRFLYSFALLLLLTTPLAAQQTEPQTALGEALVAAIADDNIVAYCQCWMSVRGFNSAAARLGVDVPNRDRMKRFMRERDEVIKTSFDKIQALVKESGVERAQLKLKSCEMARIEELQEGEPENASAGSTTILFTVGEAEWKLFIDDALMTDNIWFFTDKPVNLTIGEKIHSFRPGQ